MSQQLSDAELTLMIKDAVVCMMRRLGEEGGGNNLPNLRRYIATRFPKIPVKLRDTIIIAAFAGAQEAALSHMDTLLGEPDDRAIWVNTYFTRWSHGLRVTESAPVYVPTEKMPELEDPGAYSPSTNYLLIKQMFPRGPLPYNNS